MKAAIAALNAGQFNLYNHGTFVTKLQLTSVRFETDQQLEDFSVALARNLTIDNLSLSRNDLDEKVRRRRPLMLMLLLLVALVGCSVAVCCSAPFAWRRRSRRTSASRPLIVRAPYGGSMLHC